MEQKSKALILKVSDFAEADRLVTFFTENHGKVKGVAKHAKRSKKRFGGGVEPGSLGRISYAEKHGAELVRIDEFVVESPVWKLTSSLEKISALNITLELADRMLPPGHASRERFALISRWIDFLSSNEPLLSHKHAFFYKWLLACGLEPVFDRCSVCEKGVAASGNRIQSSHGGVVCASCYRPLPGDIMVSTETLKYLQAFKLGRLFEGADKDADRIFEMLLIHAVGRDIKSFDIARRMEL